MYSDSKFKILRLKYDKFYKNNINLYHTDNIVNNNIK